MRTMNYFDKKYSMSLGSLLTMSTPSLSLSIQNGKQILQEDNIALSWKN